MYGYLYYQLNGALCSYCAILVQYISAIFGLVLSNSGKVVLYDAAGVVGMLTS